MAESIRALVAESLARLRWGVPAAYDRLGARLADLPVRFEVDAEVFGLAAAEGGVRVAEAPAVPRVALRTDRATIALLLDGELSLRDAVWRDRLYLLGTIDDLRRLLAALETFLQGAVRAPGFAALRARL